MLPALRAVRGRMRHRAWQRAFTRMGEAAEPNLHAVPRRVVHVCGSLQPGGAERQLVYVLQAQVKRELESVSLLCHHLTAGSRQRYDFFLPELAKIGVNAREIRRHPLAEGPAVLPAAMCDAMRALPPLLASDICNLYCEFIELKPAAVHTWLDWDNVRAGFAAVLAGVPKVIISGHNLNPSNFAFHEHPMRPAYRALVQLPQVTMICTSRTSADDYADWIGVPRSRIGAVHNGVDFGDRTRSPLPAVRALRASLGIPVDAFVVGGMFRLEAEKRPLLWVETAARVASALPEAMFVVFGQGSLRETMQQSIGRAGLTDRILLPGVTTDALAALSMFDVFLLTSFAESTPNVALEAQWVGTPVVSTNVAGLKEGMEPGITGWVVNEDRPQDLAELILWLHAQPQVRSAVQERAPEFVRENFGVERMVDQLMRSY
jgi:glycosyltransferase involved in cell wall biosynthesis